MIAALTVISTVAGLVGAFAAMRQLQHMRTIATPARSLTADTDQLADDDSHADAEEAIGVLFVMATIPAGVVVAVMFFAWLLTKMVGVDGGTGWAAVIYALPLLAAVVGAIGTAVAYAASYALRDLDSIAPDLSVLFAYPDVLGRARGVALGVLPFYLGTVVVGLVIGGFV